MHRYTFDGALGGSGICSLALSGLGEYLSYIVPVYLFVRITGILGTVKVVIEYQAD